MFQIQIDATERTNPLITEEMTEAITVVLTAELQE